MIPLPIITALGSFLIGAAAKIVTMRMEMKHEEQKALMQKAGIVHEARKFGLKDAHFSVTRRIIALTLLATVVGPMWMPFIGDLTNTQVSVAVPVVDKESLKVLWGLFSYTDVDVAYKHVTTATYLPEYNHYFAAVMGLYFGAKR